MATTTTPSQGFLPAGTSVAPVTEDELCAFVRECEERKIPFTCEGNGTKRHHGPAPVEGVRRVSMRRLAQVSSYDPADMVVSVRAGTRLVDLQRKLAEHRQWLPVDPPYANATIGGVLATASAGPRRLGYGTIKDHLLGLRSVGAGGIATRSGGRVVKNVTGFDLHRLQVGAMGSLGVMVEAHFKVSTLPARQGALLLGHDSLAAALACLLEVRAAPLRPVALEVIDRGAIAALRPSVAELPDCAAVAVVGFEGSEAAFERHRRDLEVFRPRAAGAVLLEGGGAERLWQAFRDAPARAADQITVRTAVRPHDLPGLLDSFDLESSGASAVFCHAGTGIARLRLDRSRGLSELSTRLGEWDDKARARQGYAIVESAPLGIAGRDSLPWGAVSHSLGRSIKEAWDPKAILNPGRLRL
jgi:glycolate oxidase FAD binding subunit